ncbi:MAG: hypothetical protein KDI88_02610 [Gammaproteobacteria bacterium]|nr:hypothetical protein [Gammaproteobacteria bacterium]
MPARRTPSIMLAITAHGFGHATQAAPVVNRLRERFPDLRLLVLTDIPRTGLDNWLDGDYELLPLATDPGMRMHDPLRVDVDASVRAYREFSHDAPRLLTQLERLIEVHDARLVLADVPWLPLVAARRQQRPAVALCSLNWADILEPLLPPDSGIEPVIAAIRDAYRAADLFIRPAPGMPMDWLDNRHAVGHIARTGNAGPARVRLALNLPDDQRLALLQFGGERGDTRVNLPQIDGVSWLVAGRGNAGDHGFPADRVLDTLGMRFVDLVASVDVMLTKPGYGSFAEAATHGLPLLSVHRDDWPEAPWLVDWAARNLPLREISREQLATGDFAHLLAELLDAPRPRGLPPSGIDEAVDLLAPYLSR